MLIFLACVLAWFGSGILFAPKAAALGYKHCAYRYDDMKKDSARCWYYWTLFTGPAVILMWSFHYGVYRPLTHSGESRLDRALVKHDEGYRKRHLEQQEYRIRQLEAENARLTKDILS